MKGAAAAGAGGAAAAAASAEELGGSEADRLAEAAAGLAAAPPFVARLGDVALVSLHDAAPPAQLARVFNGALVGLIAAPEGDMQQGPNRASEQQQQQDGQRQQQQSLTTPALQPCIGLGLVRAVDAKQGLVYLLTDAPTDALARVRELHCGRMELPQPLLQAGHLTPPYDALFCLNTAATGSGAHKSRNNLLRASLVPQAQRQRQGGR